MPLTLLEALALAVPVVATDCCEGSRLLLDDGRHGALVAPESVDALADALTAHLTDQRPLRHAAAGGPSFARGLDPGGWPAGTSSCSRRWPAGRCPPSRRCRWDGRPAHAVRPGPDARHERLTDLHHPRSEEFPAVRALDLLRLSTTSSTQRARPAGAPGSPWSGAPVAP